MTTTTVKQQQQQQPKQQHWDDDQDGEDCFFETLDRVPSSISIDFDLPSSGSDSDQEDDVRVSFASAIAPPSCFRNCQAEADDEDDRGRDFDYGIWMAEEPMSIQERRRLLLHGMGLTSSKNLRRDPSSRRFSRTATSIKDPRQQPSPRTPSPSALVLHRSRSYSRTASPSPSQYSSLLRSRSVPPSLWDRLGDHPKERSREGSGNGSSGRGSGVDGDDTTRGGADGGLLAPAALCRIKNLDTGKEFVVSEVGKDGTWGKLNDLQTGHQLTLEEFEKCLGHSPIIKEVMRRAHLGGGKQKQPKSSSKSRSSSCSRKKGGWLKNIMFAAGSVTGLMSDKDKGDSAKSSSSTSSPSCGNSPSSSELMKVRQHGKPYKELTGLCMCQEIQAHQGSIWTIKFSSDARYLASAGEDRVVHVWQALERDISGSSSLRRDPTQQCMAACGSPDPPPAFLGSQTSKRAARKGLGPFASGRRSLPDNIVMPETIFSLSDKPVCSFHGHLDDVLDLSWSQSQHLLSSSMDKTVRLWDMETGACLKLFAHNDYVTCIQFNPIDDGYFISGSLDAKVRIWSISDRQVVDWCDLHEMVTAACYTPDGQGALVGSQKGSCRFFDTSDGRLCQKGQLEIRNKKKKSHAKKVTGFQFAPGNASEVMITSADSQIRVFDGFDMIHKFRGFRNTSSQISASFTSDGKYVVCASEDSHVYVWKREGNRSPGFGGRSKGWATTRSHEHFPCRDVSVAIPWPGSGSCCRSQPPLSSSSLRQTDSNNQHQSTKCPLDHQGSSSALEDMFHSSRSHGHPPLPKKSFSEHTLVGKEDLSCPSRSVSGIGSSSFASASPSLQPEASVSVASSSSPSTSWGWYSGSGSKTSSCVEEASAWGLVIVTAGLGGDIRIYQNFGLPVRLGRQPNLF